MREIKFRAWDIESPAMMDWEEIQDMWYSLGYGDGVLGADHWIPMQYTGIKDKDGKEIYEGDIIYYDAEDIVLIIKWTEAYSREQWCAVYRDSKLWCFEGGIPDSVDIEVIGNIVENPELIKDEG